MTIRLPSRYEDLDPQFRGKLRPVPSLNDLVQEAYTSMNVSGGIRFLPIYGRSGSGKSCAAIELAAHIPSSHLEVLDPGILDASNSELVNYLTSRLDLFNQKELFIWVIDQYEEKVQDSRAGIPSAFVERLSLLDRGALRDRRMLFLWLTTDSDFQKSLAEATSRNERILLRKDFRLDGIPKVEWPQIIEETFSFHNEGRLLADIQILSRDIEEICNDSETLGKAIEQVGLKVGHQAGRLQDLSEYQVILLWPVVDGTGIERVASFANPSQGYTLNWMTWFNRLDEQDKQQLPVKEYNRARLYFDFRIVPIPAADLHCIGSNLDKDDYGPGKSHLDQFKKTHFFTVLKGADRNFGTMSERDSKRAQKAREWYETIRQTPTLLHRRLAKALSLIDFPAEHEREVVTPHARVVGDVISRRPTGHQDKVIVELKVFSSKQTTPSGIRDEIRKTLKKYAQLAGYIPRQ